MPAISGAIFSASHRRSRRIRNNHFADAYTLWPLSAPMHSLPATSASMLPPIAWAAATVLALPFTVPLSCSTITRMLTITFASFFSLSTSSATGLNSNACCPGCWLLNFNHFQPWAVLTPVHLRSGCHLLLFGLHNIWQRRITWLIQSQINRNDRRQDHFNMFQTAINFANDFAFSLPSSTPEAM